MRSDVVLDTQRYLVFAGLTVYSVYFILQLFRHDSKAFLKFWENVNKYCKVGVPFMRGYFNLPMPYRKELLIAIGDPLFANEGESIAEFQKRYIQAVKQLFDRYVGLSPDPNHKLIIT
jgi:hypothetical protein